MGLQWWQWSEVRRRLEVWGKSLLRGRKYTMDFVVAEGAPSARQFSSRHLIQVNPTAFHDEAKYIVGELIKSNPESTYLERLVAHWQREGVDREEMIARLEYRATRALIAHEAAHALFTGDLGQGAVHHLANSLEDERIERCMAGDNPVLAPLFDLTGDLAWVGSPALNEMGGDPDNPHHVLGACLLWRWEHDKAKGKHTKLRLSLANRRRWREVKPWVEEAWTASTSDEVVAIARKILEYLGIPEEEPLPEWLKLLLAILDSPAEGSGVPLVGIPILVSQEGEGEEREPEGEPDHGIPGQPDVENAGDGFVEPMPYDDLVARATPLARRLVAELRVPQREVRITPVEYGGRYSFRQECRTPDTPFLAREDPGPEVPRMALQILGDRSGSMGRERHPKIAAARLGVMTLHLACLELDIPHAITLFDDNVLVREFGGDPQVTRALIAGWQGVTGQEHITWALEKRGPILEKRPEPIKVMVVVHDGYPVARGDPEGIRKWQEDHPHILTIGVYLGDAEDEIAAMRGLFKRLVVASSNEFPTKLGNLLRSLRPRRWR